VVGIRESSDKQLGGANKRGTGEGDNLWKELVEAARRRREIPRGR